MDNEFTYGDQSTHEGDPATNFGEAIGAGVDLAERLSAPGCADEDGEDSHTSAIEPSSVLPPDLATDDEAGDDALHQETALSSDYAGGVWSDLVDDLAGVYHSMKRQIFGSGPGVTTVDPDGNHWSAFEDGSGELTRPDGSKEQGKTTVDPEGNAWTEFPSHSYMVTRPDGTKEVLDRRHPDVVKIIHPNGGIEIQTI